MSGPSTCQELFQLIFIFEDRAIVTIQFKGAAGMAEELVILRVGVLLRRRPQGCSIVVVMGWRE
jgi:hypothetical protein